MPTGRPARRRSAASARSAIPTPPPSMEALLTGRRRPARPRPARPRRRPGQGPGRSRSAGSPRRASTGSPSTAGTPPCGTASSAGPSRWRSTARPCSRRSSSGARPTTSTSVADGPFAKGSFVDADGRRAVRVRPAAGQDAGRRGEEGAGREPDPADLRVPPDRRGPGAVCPKIAEAFAAGRRRGQAVERPEAELEEGSGPAGGSTSPTGPPGRRTAPPTPARCSARLRRPALGRRPGLRRQPEDPPTAPPARAGPGADLGQGPWPPDRPASLRDELPILPLWQIEDHYAWRAVEGPRGREHLYQGIAAWEIEPWFVKDRP